MTKEIVIEEEEYKMNEPTALQFQKYETLKTYIGSLGSVAVAFSGGVDSTFLLYAAKETLGEKVIAVTARSCSFPKRELNEAINFCQQHGIRHFICDSEELNIEGFSHNPKNRCYLCKHELFEKILKIADNEHIAALSTANPLKGALSLFLFGLGTMPLVLGFGILQSLFAKHKALVQKICSLLVIVLAFSMLLRGLSVLGINFQRNINTELEGYQMAEQKDDVQNIRITADYGNYGDFAVKAGVPVVLIIEMPEDRLTGCNNEVVCDDLGFSGRLRTGENILTFTPETPGEYQYYC